MLEKPKRDYIHAQFHDGMGYYDLKFPDCLDLPLRQLKDLFIVILREYYLNKDFESVIAPTVDEWLAYLVDMERVHWQAASQTFALECRDVSHIWDMHEKAQIKRHNSELEREVKTAKKAYEFYQKRLNAWKDLKAKYVN